MNTVGFHTLTCLFAGQWFWKCVNSYGSGAPTIACKNMTPQHNASAQTSESPYKLLPNTTTIYAGERLMLELKADGGDELKGFFIQARISEDADPLGTFYSSDHQVINCFEGTSNAVTHKDPNNKSSVMVEWEAPSEFEGDIIFRGTVAKEKLTFWTNLQTGKITIKVRGASPEGKLTTQDASTNNTPLSGGNTTESSPKAGTSPSGRETTSISPKNGTSPGEDTTRSSPKNGAPPGKDITSFSPKNGASPGEDTTRSLPKNGASPGEDTTSSSPVVSPPGGDTTAALTSRASTAGIDSIMMFLYLYISYTTLGSLFAM